VDRSPEQVAPCRSRDGIYSFGLVVSQIVRIRQTKPVIELPSAFEAAAFVLYARFPLSPRRQEAIHRSTDPEDARSFLGYSTRKTDPSRCVPAGLIFFGFCASDSLIAAKSVISCTSRPNASVKTFRHDLIGRYGDPSLFISVRISPSSVDRIAPANR
jgi:hypothetical protein